MAEYRPIANAPPGGPSPRPSLFGGRPLRRRLAVAFLAVAFVALALLSAVALAFYTAYPKRLIDLHGAGPVVGWGLLLGAAVAGVALGVFSAQQGGSAAVGMISGFAVYPALFLATASGVSLAADLRRPIWWLAEESLVKRLLVWTFATSLKGIALISVGLSAALVAAHSAGTTVALLPLGAAVVWLLRAIGLCVYALLPSQTDLRGPGALLRIVLTLLLVIPAAIVAAAVGVLTQSQGAAMLTGAGAAALEGGVMVLWAARRLRGNGMAVAQAEQR